MVYFTLKNTLCDEGLKAGTLEARTNTEAETHTIHIECLAQPVVFKNT